MTWQQAGLHGQFERGILGGVTLKFSNNRNHFTWLIYFYIQNEKNTQIYKGLGGIVSTFYFLRKTANALLVPLESLL